MGFCSLSSEDMIAQERGHDTPTGFDSVPRRGKKQMDRKLLLQGGACEWRLGMKVSSTAWMKSAGMAQDDATSCRSR